LNKSFVGFGTPGTVDNIATGNWGCGAFRGDKALKSIIQLCSASQAKKKTIEYYTFDNAKLGAQLSLVAEAIRSRGLTVGNVVSALLAIYKHFISNTRTSPLPNTFNLLNEFLNLDIKFNE
jgi:poly(ADP-ribose) glycohydrolase